MTSNAPPSEDQSFLAMVGSNIVSMCTCVKKAVREYYELPPSDQHQVWDDLTGLEAKKRVFHGGREYFSENHEPRTLVEESLSNLEKALSRRVGKNDAFAKARANSPHYVDDPKFRLKFLRAEKFNVEAAAIRMTRYFEEKMRLFGEEKLGREIMMSDLDEDDVDALTRAYFQVLPELDHSKRKVLFYFKAVTGCYRKRENLCRTFWYVTNVISMDEDAQKLGVVNVVYNLGGFPKTGMDYEKSRQLSNLFRAIPLRFNSFFVCLDEGAWFTVVDTFAVMISRFLRIRLRVIQGTYSEVQYKLKAVGVPTEVLPVNEKHELLDDHHSSWIEQRKKAEKQQPAGPPSLDYENYMNPYDISNLVQLTAPFYTPSPIDATSSIVGAGVNAADDRFTTTGRTEFVNREEGFEPRPKKAATEDKASRRLAESNTNNDGENKHRCSQEDIVTGGESEIVVKEAEKEDDEVCNQEVETEDNANVTLEPVILEEDDHEACYQGVG